MPSPAGLYYGKLVDVKCIEVGVKKTPQMILYFDITHFWDEKVAQENKWVEKRPPIEKRQVKLWISAKALETVSGDKLEAIGFNGKFTDPKFNQELYDGIDLVNKPANNYDDWEFAIWQELGQGETKPKTPVAESSLRNLDAQWRTKRQTKQPPSKAAPVAQPKTTAPTPLLLPTEAEATDDDSKDDEIPF